MLPGRLVMVSAFAVLAVGPVADAFVAPTAFTGTRVFAGAAGVGSSRVLRMSEEEPSGPTAAELSAGFAHPEAIMGVADKIAGVLPHRYPFALVDKVLHFEPGKKAIGIKCITNNEPQFTGHFPDNPIMPGVLQVEAMAQLGGLVCLQDPISDGKGTFFFGGVDGVKWRKPVVPGDVLVMEMELKAWKPKFGIAKMTGKGYVDGKVVIDVKEFTFALVIEK